MDGFDKKREMIKVLQQMLKHNAAQEVDQSIPGAKKGLPQTTPVGADVTARHDESPDMQKMSKGTAPHPHMVDLSQTNALQQRTSDSSKLAEGGMAEVTDEPEREVPSDLPNTDVENPALENLPEVPHDDIAEEEDAQKLHDENMEYEDEDNNSSSFEGFFPRKRKK